MRFIIYHGEKCHSMNYKKLLTKGCEPQAVEDLLQEFAHKGYQSDERFAMMLVRESIRKGRGKTTFYKF